MKSLPFALVLGTLLAWGCQSGPSAGTRTHWLMACDSDGDCDSDSECICQVCTASCTTSSQCDGGECAALSTLKAVCDATEQGRVCLPQDTVEMCETVVEANYGFGGATAADCDVEGVLLCEDFDAPIDDAYMSTTQDVHLRTQSCLTHEGDASLSYLGLLDAGFGHVQMPLSSSVRQGELFLRTWLYVPEGQPTASLQRFFALREVPEFNGDQLGLHLTGERGIRVSHGGGHTNSESEVFAHGEWFCLEAAFEVAEAGSVEVFVDGDSVFAVPDVNLTPEAGPLHIAVIGGSVYNPDPNFEFLVDDLVVATTRIGCE